LRAFHSFGSLLLAKCARRSRASHVEALAADPGLGLLLGLTALPKATHLTSYSYRVRRESNEKLLAALVRRLRELGMATGAAGFNVDFHAIRHHGSDVPLEKHCVPKRSQRTRSVLTFFAQDHASTEMVYANADVTKTAAAREVIAFADYWAGAAGTDPGLLVFDSQLTTYAVLDELSARGIRWLTLRQRGRAVLAQLAALPASAWTSARIQRWRHRHPQLHDELTTIKGIGSRVRQIAVANIGRDEPTLLITNDHATPAKALFTRYAERMLVENELDRLHRRLPPRRAVLRAAAQRRRGHHPHRARRQPLPAVGPHAAALSAGHSGPPDRLYQHFIDATGKLHVTDDGVTVDLAGRTYHPVLIDAGYADRTVTVPWWGGRTLRFRFPPR
jgi:hypothetical protein